MCAVDAEGQPYITLGFIKAMLEEFKAERLIHKRYAFQVGDLQTLQSSAGSLRAVALAVLAVGPGRNWEGFDNGVRLVGGWG